MHPHRSPVPGAFSALRANIIRPGKEARTVSLLDELRDKASWESYYAYKQSLTSSGRAIPELRAFIDGEGYLPVCDLIEAGGPYPLPRKAVLSKTASSKKRVVYTYPDDFNLTMKLLTYLLLRRYDGLFSAGLYSFRPGKTAKDAIRRLIRVRGRGRMYGYKADIHDYFNSVPVRLILPRILQTLSDDPAMASFLCALLTDPRVLEGGEIREEQKGIMAGTPLSAFFANLYLSDLDLEMERTGAFYARYSDDVLFLSESREETEAAAERFRSALAEKGLEINPDKEMFYAPGDRITFLGFSFLDGEVDIAPVTLEKLKGKMRRKRDALLRWKNRSEATGERAAAAFIRLFNRKLLGGAEDSELTWSYWFFSVINTTKSLHAIDEYAQDCIRVLMTGTHTKGRYRIRYGDLKKLGYRNLVHAYYAFGKSGEKQPEGEDSSAEESPKTEQ